MNDHAGKIRIDKWLWHARFFKTRSLAARQVGAGHVRVNGAKVLKPSQTVTVEDVLTFAQGQLVRVVRIVALSDRRGPAAEAQTLYFDMTETQEKAPVNPKFEGKGRPDKRSRRALGLTRIWEDH
ncbi:MAG: RNA-binding protein S4 [Alphaproteobacteria bacterium MedPE-SWcel]|nr:MAG: RNA-binding protein S4 [Alphaproteobacteria bacterium MedPE-SWcel]